MSPSPRPKLVLLSGAGISAESGLQTFRGAGGLWGQHRFEDLASPEGFARNPALVLDFYNERRTRAWAVEPNAAHRAIAQLEATHDVVVVTQNVDALHERAGSTRVLHVHGELAWARGTRKGAPRVRLDDRPIHVGDLCPAGSQLRPDVVWFGEAVRHLDEAEDHVASADIVWVVGTSLSVWPVAGLVDAARPQAHKVVVALELDRVPTGYTWVAAPASEAVPRLVAERLSAAGGAR